SVLALPASWAGAEPSRIVRSLADTLLETLHLSFVCVRLSAHDGTPPVEIMRIADATTPAGDLSIASARLGFDGEIGLIAAGSQRSDFSGHAAGRGLEVAANQATIGLQHAYLAEQRRAAQGLEERV